MHETLYRETDFETDVGWMVEVYVAHAASMLSKFKASIRAVDLMRRLEDTTSRAVEILMSPSFCHNHVSTRTNYHLF